ncbi:hypothetical protein WOLCODRAFT_20978 [Wolfiporia cocos MD-104 SS10]|uniref:DUF6534 domain-containing protein n=1 Tax=Wolfiporia cocos (strain MD-104) TaxID=742152 RepID=A0A2H3J4S4_WOLCO|nr:hypothetical protein WOLCODRAFT_20978 [Wolfiporia cocos MD-104 SS10]
MTGPNLHLDPTFGCTFISILFSTLFYGVTCAQVLYYAWEYRGDKWYTRLLVTALWLLDTATVILTINILWGYVIQSHADVPGLLVIRNPALAEYSLASVIILLVQSCYMSTIWRLVRFTTCAIREAVSNRKWYRVPMAITMHPDSIPATLQTICAASTDAYITISLTLLLRGERTGFIQILPVIQTIVFLSLPKDQMVWAIFHYPGSKIYVNSLLAMINARHTIMQNKQKDAKASALNQGSVPLVRYKATT